MSRLYFIPGLIWGSRPLAAEAFGRGPEARQAHLERSHPKKALRPAQRRTLAGWIKDRFQVSVVRACSLARFSRASYYRKSQAKDQSALRLRIRELAHARPRFGYQRIHILLRREGWL